MLTTKENAAVLNKLKQIVMLGRQAGYFLILACQRPDAKYLGDGIRDQFNFRVALGRMSELGYSMMFGEVDKDFFLKQIKGRGYVDTGTSVLSEFYTPLVPKGHDFLNRDRKIVTKQAGRTGGVRSESRRYGLACCWCGLPHQPFARYLTGGHKSTGNSQFNIEKSLKYEDFSNVFRRSVTKSGNVTFLFRSEGFSLNDTDWINQFKEKRTQYGVSQNQLAVMAGVSREYVSRLESGKVGLDGRTPR